MNGIDQNPFEQLIGLRFRLTLDNVEQDWRLWQFVSIDTLLGCLMARRVVDDDNDLYPFPFEKVAVALGQGMTVYDELRDATDDIHPLDIADYLDYIDFDGRLMQSAN